MHGIKVLAVVLIVGVILAAGVFTFVPSSRPGPVKTLFFRMGGFSLAETPEDCLEKLNRALEKRNYEAAQLYLTGDYIEFIKKGGDDATELVKAVDELSAVMKANGVKSDKVDLILFRLDPFPKFKVVKVDKTSSGATATISWVEEVARFGNVQGYGDIKIDPLLLHSLLPTPVITTMTLNVKEHEGKWRLEMPVQGTRHMRATVESLRKNATNYRNAIRDVKQSIKNNPAVKEQFETEFKTNLEKAN